MKKVAVVGAGFAGLALCWYFLEKGCRVDLYEKDGIGAGASSVASGLLHPYAGEQARRSTDASLAMEETKKLLEVAQRFLDDPVAEYSGILRTITPKQLKSFLKHSEEFKDVKIVSETHVEITSGIVVHSSLYLKGLYEACLEKGLCTISKKIQSISEIKHYDFFALALGSGIFSFAELSHLVLSKVRGQTLLCRWPFEKLEQPLLGKGHIVPGQEGFVHLGATYERGEDKADALGVLKPQARVLCSKWTEIDVAECKEGFRVVKPASSVPWIYPMGEKGVALTGMGSRGLLYHAYYAKKIVEMVDI